MKEFFNKKAIFIYGPPGSGKGTLASLLVRNFDFINFDTGQYLRKIFYNPKLLKNKIIQKEKFLNESGKLNTPSWVLKIVAQATERIAAAGWSIIFTGSPRTVFEAFGGPEGQAYGAGKKQVGLMKILEKLYGRKNIFIFELKVRNETSIRRNSNRVVCEVCGQPSLFLYTGKLPCCGFCAGPLKKRPDDNPIVIKTRLIEYQERTQPIIQILKKDGYQVFKIDGEPAPYKIFRKIAQKIND